MTDREEMWLNQPCSERELEKAVEFMQDHKRIGQSSEEAISWAAIRFGINVIKLRHELKKRELY